MPETNNEPNGLPAHVVSFRSMPTFSNPNIQSWLSTLAGALVILTGIVGYLQSNLPPKPPTVPVVQPAATALTPAQLQQIIDALKSQEKK
jgi:hypothetical protein